MKDRRQRPSGVDEVARADRHRRATDPVGTAWSQITALQRSAGNRAVAALLTSPAAAWRGPPAPTAGHGNLSAGRVPVVQRDGPLTKAAEQTGIEIEPGPVRSGSGSTFALPTSVTVSKPPGSGQGRWLTAPSFGLRLDPRGLVAGLLDQVSLGGMQLLDPTLVFDAGSRSVTAVGTVSIPTKYPGFDSPTNIQVKIRSSSLGRFEAEGRTGPFVAELTLDLSYDSEPLKRMIEAARSGDLAGAAATVPDIDRHARFGMSGTAGVGFPGHKLPLTYVRGSGTVDPSGLSVRGGAAGVIGLPQGTFRPDMPVPAAGAAYGAAKVSGDGSATGGYGFAGITGTPSIGDLATGNLSKAFAPFAYAQVMAAHKTVDGHQFTVKISAQYQLGSQTAPGSAVEQYRGDLDARRQAERYYTRSDDPKKSGIDPAVLSERAAMEAPPTIGSGATITVTGTFDLLGGK